MPSTINSSPTSSATTAPPPSTLEISWVARLRHRRSLIQFFTTDFRSVQTRELLARQKLRRLRDGFVEKLGCIGVWKKVSAAFFAAGAAAATANGEKPPAAASAASVLFSAIGKWTHYFLVEKESAAEKLKGVTSAMDVWSKIIIKDLGEISESARRVMRLQLQVDLESMEVDVITILEEKAEDYSRRVSWARARVHESILETIASTLLVTVTSFLFFLFLFFLCVKIN